MIATAIGVLGAIPSRSHTQRSSHLEEGCLEGLEAAGVAPTVEPDLHTPPLKKQLAEPEFGFRAGVFL